MKLGKLNIFAFSAIALTLSMTTIGCSGGYESAALGSGAQGAAGEVTDTVSKDVESIDSKLDEVEVSMSEVSQKMGNFNPLDLLTNGTVLSAQEQLEKLMDPLVEGVQLVRTKLDEVRVKLNLQLAKLDPNNAQQAAVIDKINLLLDKVDLIEARLKDGLVKLADVISKGESRIETAIGAMSPTNPLTIVVTIAWSNLQPVLDTWQAQLLAAAQ